MKAYLLALAIDPVEIGKSYDSLPLHCTLVHWFWLDEPKVSELIASLPKFTPDSLTLEAQNEEVFTGFTKTGTVPVTVNKVTNSPELKKLHNNLCDLLDSLGVVYEKPEYVREGHVPHVTHQKGKKVSKGDSINAHGVYLVEAEAAEYGNPRRVLHTIRFNNKPRPDTLVVLQQVVQALELRFPNHNGPFEYGTRLAEEVGELIEAASEVTNGLMDDTKKHHLLKEMEDVLRVVYGITGLYDLVEKLPTSFDTFDMTDDPKDLMAYIVQLGIRGGELASSVNHAEGMGVKKEKHGDTSPERVRDKAYALAQVVIWMTVYFNVEQELETQITKAYLEYKELGYTKTQVERMHHGKGNGAKESH